jgi:hypothetical protein
MTVPSFSFAPRRGNAAVEVALMLPWLVFTFIGILDFGFCAYSLIATQNAARVVAMYGAASSANLANIANVKCGYAADELKYAPTPVSGCGTALSVTTSSNTTFTAFTEVQVTVTYTVNLMGIPGIMPGSLAISRTVALPVRS